MRPPNSTRPAVVQRTGHPQIAVQLTAAQADRLESLRLEHGFRSWAQVVRKLIDDTRVWRGRKPLRGYRDTP